MAGYKTFKTKKTLAVARNRNKPVPQWFRLKTDSKIKWNNKRRHWRRTSLGL
jgi:large subunit ribosomal protein L39e